MSAVETREQHDTRLEAVERARKLIDQNRHPETALVNGAVVAHYCEWLIYLSALLDRVVSSSSPDPTEKETR